MVSFDDILRGYEFARRNVFVTAIICIFIFFGYLGYQFLGGYASTLGQSFAQEYLSFQRSVASYTIVDTILHEYLNKFNASRVGILRFHDSVRDPANNPVYFATLETMVTAPGVTSNLAEMKELPAITFGTVLETLMDNKPTFVLTGQLASGPLRELLDRRGDRAVLFVPLHDLTDHIVGMMLVSWLSEHEVPNPDERLLMIKELTPVADRLGAYFSASR